MENFIFCAVLNHFKGENRDEIRNVVYALQYTAKHLNAHKLEITGYAYVVYVIFQSLMQTAL